jgi:hypothetical protein
VPQLQEFGHHFYPNFLIFKKYVESYVITLMCVSVCAAPNNFHGYKAYEINLLSVCVSPVNLLRGL